MQVGANPGGHVGGDRTLAEQVDRDAARGARVGVDALRSVRAHFGVERLRQVHAVDLVPAPLVLLILAVAEARFPVPARSEEHTSELPSLMRISSAVSRLKNTQQPTQR